MESPSSNKVVESLLREYEDVINSLKIHLDINKEEQKNFKEEIQDLVKENEKLSSKLDAEYTERLKEQSGGNSSDTFNSELLSNLQKQLDLCKKEKERALELYETSLILIEKLEEEVAQKNDSSFNSNQIKACESVHAKELLEAKLKTTKEHLDIALNGRDQLEEENIRQKTEIAKLKINVEANEKLIEELKMKEMEWKNNLSKYEQDYIMLNTTYECVLQSRNELEKKAEAYVRKIEDLLRRNNESKNKVAEALDVVEKAIFEKQAGAMREHHLEEEVQRLQLCVDHVIEEAGKKVATEVEETVRKYDAMLQELTKEFSATKKELDEKRLENKKISFRYKKLERLTSAKLDKEKITLIKGSEAEITILENHLESVYQELERFKIKYDEIALEKTQLEKNFEDSIEKHSNLIREKESFEADLEEEIEKLKSLIQSKTEESQENSKRCEYFLSQLREVQEQNNELNKIVKKCICEKLKTKVRKLNEIRIMQTTELESHVESQMKLNETWKTEIKEMTEKFEEKIRGVKKEAHELKMKNKLLTAELTESKKKMSALEKP